MTLMILAAGMGSRYGGIKQIEPIGRHKELIIDYSIYDAILAGFDKVVFIIRRDIEKDFCETIFNRIKKHVDAQYVFQSLPDGRAKPWGTVHAMLAARGIVDEPFCVINADDFYGREAFIKAAEFFKSLKKGEIHNYASVNYKLGITLSDTGSVSRGCCKVDENGMITEINERLKIERKGERIVYLEDDNYYELSPDTDTAVNFFAFTPDAFSLLGQKFNQFVAANFSNPKAELPISVAVNELLKERTITLKNFSVNDKWLGFTYPEDKKLVKDELDKLIGRGVYPTPLWDKK